MTDQIKVLLVGLGPIGQGVAKLVLDRPRFVLVGAVDSSPLKAGQPLHTLLDRPSNNLVIQPEFSSFLDKTTRPDVAIITTSSHFQDVFPLAEQLVQAGIHVLTSCEQMVYPWNTQPQLTHQLDTLAKQQGVSVLGTGINPGFLMDFAPLVFSVVCPDVQKIVVERIQDAQFRRIPFQKKIGMGLSRDQFFERVKEGALQHVGLIESIHMIAAKLGWGLDEIEQSLEPVIANRQVFFGDIFIAKGDILGITQVGRGLIKGKEAIRLVFCATIGEPNPHDRIVISGSTQVDMTVKNGLNGDTATCSILVNTIQSLVNAQPGFRTMIDIEPISYHP